MPTTLRKPLRKVGKAPKNARKQRAAASGLPLGSIHRSDTPLVYASPITHGVDADDAEEAQRVVKRAMERRRGDGAFDPYLRKYAALPQHTASQRRLRRAYILHDIAMLLAVLVPALWWWGARVAARVRPQLRFYCVGPSSGAATPRSLAPCIATIGTLICACDPIPCPIDGFRPSVATTRSSSSSKPSSA